MMTQEARKWRQVPWLRIGAEAVAIIASILIAFSLDAWWDSRQSAAREQQHLLSLDRDFHENHAELERTIQIQDTVLQSIQELVLLGATTSPIPNPETVRRLIARVFRDTAVEFTPTLGTYRELLNTSSLQVLRNDSLRVLLSDFDVSAQRVGRVEARAADSWNRNVTEHLQTRLDFVTHVPEDMFGPDQRVEIRPSDIDVRSLPRDRVFANVMVGRLALTAVRLSMYRDLRSKVNQTLRILAAELVDDGVSASVDAVGAFAFPHDPALSYVRIYADPEGESHFEDVQVSLDLVEVAPGISPLFASSFSPASRYAFLRAEPGWREDWHPAPQRQFLVYLAGVTEFEVSDGEIRRLGPGTILLAEDTVGEGHISEVVGEEDVVAVLIQLGGEG